MRRAALSASTFPFVLAAVLGSKGVGLRVNDAMPLRRLSRRDEMFGAVANKIPPPHLFERFAQ